MLGIIQLRPPFFLLLQELKLYPPTVYSSVLEVTLKKRNNQHDSEIREERRLWHQPFLNFTSKESAGPQQQGIHTLEG